MGTTAALSAIRSVKGPSLDAEREAFRERLRAQFVLPFPRIEIEFGITLDGLWPDLLRVFSGGADSEYPRERKWHLVDSEAWPSPKGVWAVRGRRPGPPEGQIDGQTLFNDVGDVRQIADWLERGPTEAFVSHFRARHEAYVDELIEQGYSPEEIE